MPNYRRIRQLGGVYFFTVNLAKRNDNDLLTREIDALKRAIRTVRRDHPFGIHAWAVLPEHMHCMLELPGDESSFATRWRLMKSNFSRSITNQPALAPSCRQRGEKGIWQRRFWEHLITDDEDFRRHADYVHFNPVKHALVKQVADWPHSTFHRWVDLGLYPKDWAGGQESALDYDD